MTLNWVLLGLVVLLIALSAYFVAAEFALIAARRTIIEPMAVNSARARSTLKAMENVSLMMATARNWASRSAACCSARIGEPAVAALLEPVFAALGVPEAWLHPVALVIALLLVVSAHVALGEMVPKNIAIAGPERVAIMLAPALSGDRHRHRADHPHAEPLRERRGAVDRPGTEGRGDVGVHPRGGRGPGGGVPAGRSARRDEHQRITSALDFDTTVVAEVMVPDADVVSVEPGVTAAEIERICARTGFSRFPIIEPDGRFSGYLHIRDVVDIPAERRDEPVPARPHPGAADICRPRWTCGPRWTGCAGSAHTWRRSPTHRLVHRLRPIGPATGTGRVGGPDRRRGSRRQSSRRGPVVRRRQRRPHAAW